MKRIIYICALILLTSCGPREVKSKKVNFSSSTQLFTELWEIFDHNYAFFKLRQINWQAEKESGLKMISSITDDSLLFNEFCLLLKKFDDSHINIESDDLNLNCNCGELPAFYKEFPTDKSFTTFLEARDKSLNRIGIEQIVESKSQLFQHGSDVKGVWGYLRIKRFYGERLDQIRTELDDIFKQLRDVDRLLLDIRVNPGGNDETALLCASYFFNQKEIAFIKKIRNGKGHEDFSKADTTYIIPNRNIYSNNQQIFLLTNGASGSSADVFALVMSYLPNLKIVGTNTEGIFSDMYRDTLSNGWRITLSNERYFTKDMKCYERIGVPVDVRVENRKTDINNGIDLIIDKITEK